MKKLVLFAAIIFSLASCKMIAKGAARYWTKKQIKEFVANCEQHSSRLMSEEKAKVFCDCAVDQVSEKYHDFEDVRKAGIIEVLKTVRDCNP